MSTTEQGLEGLDLLPERREGAHPARYALELRPDQDPVLVEEAVREALAGLAARVEPLSPSEPDVLLVELSSRTLDTAGSAQAFAAGHLLAERFDLQTAEPDLPTAFFPDEPPASAGLFVEEGLGRFPPGCWADAEPHLSDTPRWALERMHVPEAWEFSVARHRPSRGAGIVIAQPDTGITRHRELEDVLVVPGFDVLDDDDDPTDPMSEEGNPGHGTATASVVISGEALVVTGSAPAARHMAIRAVERVVRVRQVTVARAIDWAVEHGAHVITMSLGGIPTVALHRAVRRAVEADVVVLAAAGNCVRTVVWPARYDECIAVAGTDVQDRRWPGSCRGAAVDVSAPAQNVIRASVPRGAATGGDDVGQGQGTSFAVALTAGVAALWLAHHGRANLVREARRGGETVQAMFRRLVRATARRPEDWDPFEMGAGVVDARALLEADLDLGRDRESTVVRPGDEDVSGVTSLVTEALGPEAVDGLVLDWSRFGPELATALLSQRIAGAPPGPPEVVPEGPSPVRTPGLSPQLAESLVGVELRQLLGLPDVDQPDTLEPALPRPGGTE